MESRTPAKHILIVDDEESVAYSLQASLTDSHRGYQVDTAASGPEALSLLGARPYDLVVTDLKMAGMDGLELMGEIRRTNPQTRLIMMTAYGSQEIEEAAYRLGACRYINKPFSIEDFRAAVHAALAEPRAPGRSVLAIDDATFEEVVRCLADTRFEVGAQCILLANVTGQMVAHVGVVADLDLGALLSLVGGSFATAFEMRRFLGETQALTLNYHEGERYDVYSSNVNEDLFIVLLFDRRKERSRVGMVWLYTKRALARLRDLLAHVPQLDAGQLLDADFGSQLSESLDSLWLADETPEPRVHHPAAGQRPAGSRPSTANPPSIQTPIPAPMRPADAELQPLADGAGETEDDDNLNVPPTFSLQQALEMGLLDPEWLNGVDGLV